MSYANFIRRLPELISAKIKATHALFLVTYVEEVNRNQPCHGSILLVGHYSSREKAWKVWQEIREVLEKTGEKICMIHPLIIRSGGWGLLQPGSGERIDPDAEEYYHRLEEQNQEEEARMRVLSQEIQSQAREAKDPQSLSGAIYNWYCLSKNFLQLERLRKDVKETSEAYEERRQNLITVPTEVNHKWSEEILKRLESRNEGEIGRKVLEVAEKLTRGTLEGKDLPGVKEVWSREG